MGDFGRLIALLLLGGGALAGLGAFCVWFLDEGRRVRRSLGKIVGNDRAAELVVKGRGRGVALDLNAGTVGVCWDAGGWCLAYRLEELLGVEVIVDGFVAGRVHRGESRRPLEQMAQAEAVVRLRFVFDDAAYPDFEIDLWQAGDEDRRHRMDAPAALEEANRWLARADAVLRRPSAPRSATTVSAPAAEDTADVLT